MPKQRLRELDCRTIIIDNNKKANLAMRHVSLTMSFYKMQPNLNEVTNLSGCLSIHGDVQHNRPFSLVEGI